MKIGILLLVALAFVGYAVYSQYKNTDSSQSVLKRVWASVVAAGAAVGASVMAWFQS